jgi:hypothetical protein
MSVTPSIHHTAPVPHYSPIPASALTVDASLKGSPYVTQENAGEIARLVNILAEIQEFYEEKIQWVIDGAAYDMRAEIEQTAPYDWQELDDYHMKDHMIQRDYDGKWGKGQEVESEAPYSGLLEYGTARHGVQHVFFRPSVERGQREYKKIVIGYMKGIIRG